MHSCAPTHSRPTPAQADAETDWEGLSGDEAGEALMAAIAEGRAARLANRRTARELGVTVPQAVRRRPQAAPAAARDAPRGQRQQQQQQQQQERPRAPQSNAAAVAATAAGGNSGCGTQRRAAAAAAGVGGSHSIHGLVLKQAGNVRGPPKAAGVRRDSKCFWCGSDESLMLGCSQ